MKIETEWLWCCKICGAGYDELPDGCNGCQECGIPNTLVRKKVWINENVVPTIYREFPYLKGMKV